MKKCTCSKRHLMSFHARHQMSNDMQRESLKLGLYEHYKGKQYEVIGVGKHSETLDELVVYRALDGEKEIWIRPLSMFLEEVEVDGIKKPRFRYLGK